MSNLEAAPHPSTSVMLANGTYVALGPIVAAYVIAWLSHSEPQETALYLAAVPTAFILFPILPAYSAIAFRRALFAKFARWICVGLATMMVLVDLFSLVVIAHVGAFVDNVIVLVVLTCQIAATLLFVWGALANRTWARTLTSWDHACKAAGGTASDTWHAGTALRWTLRDLLGVMLYAGVEFALARAIILAHGR